MRLRQLEMELQKVVGFSNPSVDAEQYTTTPTIAARLLYHAAISNDISNKIVCDLGCGTGMLSIGAALLGAKKVIAIDFDSNAIQIAKNNVNLFNIDTITFIEADVRDLNIDIKADTVVMNPPFGAQHKHADRPFIDAAIKIAPVCYGIFNAGSSEFVRSYTNGKITIDGIISAQMSIPKQFSFHTHDVQEIPVDILYMKRI
ncbi:MAG TPA: METTL5 family protein [Methanocorpusculum sp.]|nr:METTL5 family protein [Methanocorpusculum sp.]